MQLPEVIQATIEQHGLLDHAENVVVAVSGGADSVALLYAFKQLGISCTVAHMNHGLRGEESDGDEQFVRHLAEKLGYSIITESANVRELAEETGQSLEMAARQTRHKFFEQFKDAVIALAHHRDDQTETFILKLARGAGSEGLCGMPYAQQLGPIHLIRPMLDVSRSDIIIWLEENGFAWREDASNTDQTFLRNRIRHRILPMLEKELNPNIRETILRTMEILRQENAWMQEMQDQSESLAARRRQLRKWLFDNGAEEAGFDAVEKILSLMADGEGSAIYELNNRQRVVVEYGKPRFESGPPRSDEPPRWKLAIKPKTGWVRDESRIGQLPAEASFDADMVGGASIRVRSIEPGDRMAPLGMEGRRKLQDILTDLKIPKAQRSRLPIVTCRDEIIWLPGYRIARGWEVRGDEAESVHVRIAENGTD